MSQSDSNARVQPLLRRPAPEAGRITLTLDPAANEWSLDFTPGLDLLEIIQVFNSVQQRALELLDRQLYPGPAAVPGSDAAGPSRPAPHLPVQPHDPSAAASA